MCKKLRYLISFLLVLTLVTSTWAVVIDSWEAGVGAWEIMDPSEILAQSTTGVTDGTYSLQRNFTAGWHFIDLDVSSFIDDLNANDTLEVDVTTSVTAEQMGWWLEGVIVLQGGYGEGAGDYYLQSPVVNIASPDGSPTTTTVSFKYGPEMVNSPLTSWAKIRLITNTGPGPGGVLYYDKLRAVSAAVPTQAGVVFGDWENNMDGWVLAPDLPGTTVEYSSTHGVTLNSYSLRMYVPGSGYQKTIYLSLLDKPALLDAFRKGQKIQMDVTRLAAEWPGDIGWGGQVHMVVNAGGDGWSLWEGEGQGWWTPDQGDSTMTLEWDYTGSLAQIDFDNVWWLELFIIPNCGGETSGVYYFDNLRIPIGLQASQPNPPDGATDVSRDVDLSWKSGTSAGAHDVYFGTDANAVADATTTDFGSYPGLTYVKIDVNSYDPGLLELQTTYYWRVDEVNEPDIWPSDVWSFTTGEFITVDDFEDYNDYEPGRIFDTWIDGWNVTPNGSQVGSAEPPFAEQTIVHRGKQSMPFSYNNSGDARYSEAERTFEVPQDWTAEGVKALTLWFYGAADNDANATEQMYVKVNGVMVTYDGDMNDIKQEQWQEWSIDLAAFGVNLTNVTNLAIGFGDAANTTPGSSGTMYFDDIRLYRPRCLLSMRSADFAKVDYAPTGKPAGDCMVDYRELEIMASDWLTADDIIATQAPGSAGKVAYYPLNEGSGTTVGDASGNGNNGTIYGDDVKWVESMQDFGSALEFPGTRGQYVNTGTWNPSAATGQITVAVWIKWAGLNGEWQGVIGKRDGWTGTATMWQIELNNETGNIGFSRYNSYPDFGLNVPPVGQWQHVAVRFDGTTCEMYIDGKSVGTSTDFSFGPKTDAHVVFGAVEDNGGNAFNGTIDEVYIYNRALSPAEVAYLADTTPGDGELYYRIPSPAELYEAEHLGSRAVDWKDFAVLADMWLEEQPWP